MGSYAISLRRRAESRDFDGVGFTFSPSYLGTKLCCVFGFVLGCLFVCLFVFFLFVCLFVCLVAPWYLGFLQLLHFLFNNKSSSDRRCHELDRLQRKKNFLA